MKTQVITIQLYTEDGGSADLIIDVSDINLLQIAVNGIMVYQKLKGKKIKDVSLNVIFSIDKLEF